jgi:TetR/AcrR family transcriptional repressor of nem operon
MARKVNPELRARIIKEAEHLIHLQGFHCTSLEDIATQCSMTKANVLHHFKSKEDLGLAVLEYKIELYKCNCLERTFGDGDPVDCINQLFSDSARHYKANGCKAGCFFGNIALEMADLNERFRLRVEEFFEHWISCLEQVLKRQRAAGAFAPTLKPRATAESLFALYEGAIMLARTRRDPGVFTRVGQQARTLLEAHRVSTKKTPVEV